MGHLEIRDRFNEIAYEANFPLNGAGDDWAQITIELEEFMIDSKNLLSSQISAEYAESQCQWIMLLCTQSWSRFSEGKKLSNSDILRLTFLLHFPEHCKYISWQNWALKGCILLLLN